MTRSFRSAGVVLLSLALPAVGFAQEEPAAERYRLRVEWRSWKPDLSSKIQKGFGAEPGTRLDFKDDLGVKDERTWEVHGGIKFSPAFKLLLTYIPLDYAGRTGANTNFSYGDQFYFRGELVVTNFQADIYGGAVQWDFVRRPTGYLGVLVGARLVLADSVVLAPDLAKRVVDSETVPVPIVGLTGRAYAGKRLSLSGSFSGLSIGERGKYWELDLSGRIHLSDRLAGQVGWRRISLQGQDERDFVKLILSGVTFGVELSL